MSDLTTHSELVPSARQEGDALILKVRGEVDLHSSPDLRTSLLALLQSTGAKKLILNLPGGPRPPPQGPRPSRPPLVPRFAHVAAGPAAIDRGQEADPQPRRRALHGQ